MSRGSNLRTEASDGNQRRNVDGHRHSTMQLCVDRHGASAPGSQL